MPLYPASSSHPPHQSASACRSETAPSHPYQKETVVLPPRPETSTTSGSRQAAGGAALPWRAATRPASAPVAAKSRSPAPVAAPSVSAAARVVAGDGSAAPGSSEGSRPTRGRPTRQKRMKVLREGEDWASYPLLRDGVQER